MSCPFCEIKANADKRKLIYPVEKGPKVCECGAWLDAGQYSLTVKGYKGIYDGAVGLVQHVVDQFKEILSYYDVELDDDVEISLYASEIIEWLFLNGEGGTSKSNFSRAIGINYGVEEFKLYDDDDEAEDD